MPDTPRTLSFTPIGWADFEWWLDQDRKVAKKVRSLIKECLRTPMQGTGKPEPLKHQTGLVVWSRRITEEHRLVYAIDSTRITIVQARFHYDD